MTINSLEKDSAHVVNAEFSTRVTHFLGDQVLLFGILYYFLGESYKSALIAFGTVISYLFLMELIFQRTIFKLITGSKVVSVKERRLSVGDALIRTLARLVPFDLVSNIFVSENNVWWHDSWSKTRVVNCRKSTVIQSSDTEITNTTVTKTKIIELCYPNGEIHEFADYDALREEIINGNIKRDFRARIKGAQESNWSSLEKVSKINFRLLSLYEPVWAYTMKFFWYGVICGIILKAMDTTWLLFEINSKMGFMWLLMVASLLLSKWWKWGPLVVIFVSIKSGVKLNLFMMVFPVTIVGAIFGAPAGMILGTIVGHFKKGKHRASDSQSEGSKPYLLGLLAPVLFLAIVGSLYLFWLNPKMIEWLSK